MQSDRTVKLYTSEFVSPGHPDMIADTVSDAIVDYCIETFGEKARAAVETLIVDNNIIVAGEVTGLEDLFGKEIYYGCILTASHKNSKLRNLIIDAIRPTFNACQKVFNEDRIIVTSYLRSQSPDIAVGVDTGGAGDQGIMYAFSCDWNNDRLPMPLFYARRLCHYLVSDEFRNYIGKDLIGIDCKTQVTMEFDGEKWGQPKAVVCSIQHSPLLSIELLREIIRKKGIDFLEGVEFETRTKDKESAWPTIDWDTDIWHINPTGLFTIGGSEGDTGVTGRKIIVGSFGGFAHHGGGAMPGKDFTKVDRTAVLYLRWICNKIIEEKMAHYIELSVGYAIGVAEPTNVTIVDIDEASKKNIEWIEEFVLSHSFIPKAMIETLGLGQFTKCKSMARYGHFGMNPEVSKNLIPWENV